MLSVPLCCSDAEDVDYYARPGVRYNLQLILKFMWQVRSLPLPYPSPLSLFLSLTHLASIPRCFAHHTPFWRVAVVCLFAESQEQTGHH